MNQLDLKALDAAHEACPGTFLTDDRIRGVIRAYLDAADLVPRSMLDVAIEGKMLMERQYYSTQTEGDEVRAQVAALREALDHIADHPPWGGEDITDYIKWMQKVARAALTDTAEAAAGGQKMKRKK